MYRILTLGLFPTEEQKQLIDYNLWSVRFIYNNLLQDAIDNSSPTISEELYLQLIKDERVEKSDMESLYLTYKKLSLQWKLYKLNKKGRPHFCSSRKLIQMYLTTQTDGFKYLGELSTSAQIPKGRTCYVVKYRDGRYFLKLTHDVEVENPDLDINKSVGIDYDVRYFFVTSDGEKAVEDIPNFRKTYLKVIEASTSLRSLPSGSDEYKNQEKRVAFYNRRFHNIKRELYYQLASQLLQKYDYIFLESLDMHKIINTEENKLHYGCMLGWTEFISILKQRAEIKGKTVIHIDKWYPSSKRCSYCGFINKKLSPNDAEWVCPECGILHDRDVNAALNILEEGLRKL